MTIDMHSHWKPPELADALRARSELPRIATGGDGADVLETRRGTERLAFDDVEGRIASMDRLGIDAALISMQPGFGWMERLAVQDSLPLVRLYNDSISRMCTRHAPRFTAVCAVPLANLSAAAEEFERAMALPGIVGVNLPGDGFLTYQRAQDFRPILEVANRHRALVFIHRASLPDTPTGRPERGIDNFVERDSTLDMQSSLSKVMVTLCLTDLMDDYPDAVVMTHNLGGNIPFEIERMDHRATTAGTGRPLPSALFRDARVVVDCNSLGPRAIERAVEVYGADRIVFGTDGSDFGAEWSLDAMAETRLDEDVRRAILHDNAAALLASLGEARQAAE